MNKIVLNIDGSDITAEVGKSLLSVARENGIYIPTLCYHPRARKAGKCRICVVEVKGLPGLQVSCSLAAVDGMVVRTDTKRIIETRKMIVELYLASGKHDCTSCEADGVCELQNAAKNLGIEKSGFPVSDQGHAIDPSSPMIIRDMNKCIQCGRCIVGCNELVVNEVIELGYRGSSMSVVCDLDSPMGESSCVICGECVQLCPTGALIEKKPAGKESNRDTVKVRTTCPYCGVGCQIFLHVRDNEILKVTGVETAKPNYGSLCIKGRFGYDFVNSPDRLKSPLVRKDGKLVEVSWEEALDYTAEKLSWTRETHGPDSIVGIGCARTTNEDNYLMMKLMRGVIGTNNIDHCART